MLRKLALRPQHLYHPHHLVSLIVAVLIKSLLQCLQSHQLPHLFVSQQTVGAYRIQEHVEVKCINPISHLPGGYLVRTLRKTVGKQGGEERHVVVVVIEYGLVFDIFVEHLAAGIEVKAVLHAGQLVTFVTVKELVLRVGGFLRHLQHQAVEITFLRAETGVEINPVGINIVCHHGLKIRNHAVQLICRHVDELQRQHLGCQIHIALLIHIPVETRHIPLIVAPWFHKERLAVVLNLQHHHGGVIGIGLEFKSTVASDNGLVHCHLTPRQHVAITIQKHLLARPIHYLTMNGDIGLSTGRTGKKHKQSYAEQFD